MIYFVAILVGTVCLSLGVCLGVRTAETHAIRHSDCATAHHMGDGFYYIVPESEYVKLILLRHQGRAGSGAPQLRDEPGHQEDDRG